MGSLTHGLSDPWTRRVLDGRRLHRARAILGSEYTRTTGPAQAPWGIARCVTLTNVEVAPEMAASSFVWSPDTWLPPDSTRTDDFVIRSYVPGDGRLLADALNESYEHLRTFMTWVQPLNTTDDAELVVRRGRANYLLRTDFMLGIFSGDETRLIGGSGFHLREGDLSSRRAEIGMWVAASESSKGLATAVLKELLRWGFTEWPWDRLSWNCSVENVASRRVAEKAGMTLEGTLRQRLPVPGPAVHDQHCFSMLRTEWEARRVDPEDRE